MSENGQKRFELIELVSPKELQTQILAFAKIAGTAAGVVRQPGEGEGLPPSASDPQDWRLTPVMYFDKHGSLREKGSKLCELIRTLDSGSKACMRSDLTYAHQAFTDKQPVGYICETAHLREYISAISVGGHHLANVYLGQVRLKTSDPEAAWNEFKKLQGLACNATAVANVTKEQFIDLFDELPDEASVPEEGTIKTALAALASLISSRASRQGALKVVEEITSEVGASTTIREGLEVFWRKIGRILHFSSGGLYLIEGEWLVPSVSSYPKMLAQDMQMHIYSKEGIAPWVVQKGEAVRFDSRAEMDEKLPPAVSGSRDERKVQSLIACPLRTEDGSIVGVLEVGSEEKRIFTEDDKGLLVTLANFAAAFVKSARRQNFLQRITQETNIEKLLEFLVRNMPGCLGGTGCSVFLRDYGGWDAQRAVLRGARADSVVQEVNQQDAGLRATSEFKASACGKLLYKSGEGLTGWVLKHKRPLRIPAGKDARLPSNLRAFADSKAGVETPIWEGKIPEEGALRPKAYFEDLGYLWGAPYCQDQKCPGLRWSRSPTVAGTEGARRATGVPATVRAAARSRSPPARPSYTSAGVR